MSTTPPVSASPSPTPTSQPIGQPLLTEITDFRKDCHRRYLFNNRWDIALTLLGILLSIAVVAAGFFKSAEVSAILGAVVGAVITAQKAFPFGQRASFYRLLLGQTDNLSTRATEGLWNRKEVVDTLGTLRMDYAQQLPRGSSTPADPAPPTLPHPSQAAATVAVPSLPSNHA